MERRMELFRGHRFLGSRGGAHQVRVAAEELLRREGSAVIVLDFAGVDGVSHGFADELLSPLSELLHDKMRRRVKVVNCSDKVWKELKLVAGMHRLFLPAATKRAKAAA